MKKLLKKIRIWLGLEEENWWDRDDAGPVAIISGVPLADALRRRSGAMS